MFLPPRYSTIWTPQDIDSIIRGREKYYLLKMERVQKLGKYYSNWKGLNFGKWKRNFLILIGVM
jgi:hypothetical protein